MTNQQGAPAALRLANALAYCDSSVASQAAAELRRLHAENAALQQGYDAARMEIEGLRDRVQELGAMLRENRSKRIVELEAENARLLRQQDAAEKIIKMIGQRYAVPEERVSELEAQRIADWKTGQPDYRTVPQAQWREAEDAASKYRMEADSLRDQLADLTRKSMKRIIELESQLEAIGAGGVEPLRRRVCLHQIMEPAPAHQEAHQTAPVNAWQQAIDHELVTAHLGVAGAATLEEARKTLHELICWHIDVATDPATNGGKVLVDAARAPADSVLEDAARLDWLESQSQVNIERVRYLGADTSIYEVTPFNGTDYNGETLRKAIDSARKQGANHD